MKLEELNQPWYALQIRARWERSTAEILENKGYETLVPVYQVDSGSKESRNKVAPLFPGYTFCRFDIHDRLPILTTPGVVSIVGNGRKPIPVEESEIESLRVAVASGVAARPCPYLEVGQKVRIESGPLAGQEGLLTAVKGFRRVVLSISILRRSVALELDRTEVSPVRDSYGAVLNPNCPDQVLEPVPAW